ncbi:MAG TPA: glycosyltransferase family 2 protein [Nitrososphaera sp.]|nr:glycosyltransferase family 2 protein [Nitrososphaera sp.]
MKLIANMIGRNEVNRFLPEVLKHLVDVVDDIVFTDDASTDDTPLVAGKIGAHVKVLSEPLFSIDEGRLRSLAWEHLSEFAKRGDWILAIDCDELFYQSVDVRMLMEQYEYDVLGVTFYHMWDPINYRIDKAWAPTISSRLFRFFPGGEFRQRRLACGSEPTYVTELIRRRKVLWHSGLVMQHLGYMRDEDKMSKYQRYMELDGGDFHARAHLESILDPEPVLIPWTYGD